MPPGSTPILLADIASARPQMEASGLFGGAGSVVLRTVVGKPLDLVDTEAAAELAWWLSAWPELAPGERKKLMDSSRPKGKRP
jgi:hypothetical protein